jgi:hypothetical protein
MLDDKNIAKLEGFLDNQQTARKIEVCRETGYYSSGGNKYGRIKKNSRKKRINTSLSRKLRRSLRKNPSLRKSLKKLIKCSGN